MSKSARIRELYDQGMSVGECAKQVGVRYQFAYNVVRKQCDKEGEEVRRVNKVTKSDQFRELAAQGKTPGEVAKHFNANYSFVHQVLSKWAKDNPKAAEPMLKAMEAKTNQQNQTSVDLSKETKSESKPEDNKNKKDTKNSKETKETKETKGSK